MPGNGKQSGDSSSEGPGRSTHQVQKRRPPPSETSSSEAEPDSEDNANQNSNTNGPKEGSKSKLNKKAVKIVHATVHTSSVEHFRSTSCQNSPARVLCAVRVLGEPVLTTTTTCSTTVGSSLGSAGLPQWSQTQVYALQMFISLLSKASSSRQMQGVVVTALSRRHEL